MEIEFNLDFNFNKFEISKIRSPETGLDIQVELKTNTFWSTRMGQLNM